MNDRTPAPSSRSSRSGAARRRELIADTALALLAERGMRGLTHRAVDETAGLPQGSTSNLARTRAALLETAVGRLAEREAALLTPAESAPGTPSPDALADLLALALHRSLTRHRELLIARYELALEATRRPELRAVYDRAGSAFREALAGLLAAAGSADPQRHARSLVAWCDGVLFSGTAGQLQAAVPARAELRAGCSELLNGMLGSAPGRHS
ncbi:TetR/AcrR family transcriptional regulator [Streptomyces ochraceiscleroticus]|uniref:TetR/AcrR family transcriptional regulator n=1 Tax=Streptomyces ochraceiscleroticus TaxID=47761 RepID=A0ABW1MHF0_9ACTN|nr:TetR/AcrR family transcriptional regulator [Streptomyces ochraceiscleroticus]